MPAFVKSYGSWKSLDSLSVKDGLDWKSSQNGWVCQEWGMASADVVFNGGSYTAQITISPVLSTHALPEGTVVQVRRADGKYFQATVSVEPDANGLVTLAWTATTVNAPGAGTLFKMTPGAGEVATHVLYWARILSPAASVIGDTNVPETFGGVSTTWPEDTGAFTIIKFGTPGTQSFRVTREGLCDLVIIGAGGGGGYGYLKSAGGGGGAGKAVLVRNHLLTVGDHDVVVGAGGRGGVSPSTSPTSGGFSQFRGYQAQGGGAGANGSRGLNGSAGGSGGGGGGLNIDTTRTNGGAVAAQWTAFGEMEHSSVEMLGYAGGRGGAIFGDGGQYGGAGGGGGGAGSEGGAGAFDDDGAGSGGAAGSGVLFTEAAGRFVPGADFVSTVFAKGGAGGAGTIGNPEAEPAEVGAAGNTAGSGGAGGNGNGIPGGAGADGAVYVIYKTYQGPGAEETPPTDEEETDPASGATGGVVTESYTDTDGQSWKIHTFAASGTFTVTTAGKFDLFLLGGGGGAGATRNLNVPMGMSRLPGGGGGGGGILLVRGVQLAAGAYAVTVGAAGAGGTLTGSETTWLQTAATSPVSGGDSTFPGGFVARGGGHGSQLGSAVAAASGGCGGGVATGSGNPGSAIAASVPATGFDAPHYQSGAPGYPLTNAVLRGFGGSSEIVSVLGTWLYAIPSYASIGVGGFYDQQEGVILGTAAGRGGYAYMQSSGYSVAGGSGTAGLVVIAYKI